MSAYGPDIDAAKLAKLNEITKAVFANHATTVVAAPASTSVAAAMGCSLVRQGVSDAVRNKVHGEDTVTTAPATTAEVAGARVGKSVGLAADLAIGHIGALASSRVAGPPGAAAGYILSGSVSGVVVPLVEEVVADATESAVDRAIEIVDDFRAASRATVEVAKVIREELPNARRDAERIENSVAGVFVEGRVAVPAVTAWRVGRRYVNKRRADDVG